MRRKILIKFPREKREKFKSCRRFRNLLLFVWWGFAERWSFYGVRYESDDGTGKRLLRIIINYFYVSWKLSFRLPRKTQIKRLKRIYLMCVKCVPLQIVSHLELCKLFEDKEDKISLILYSYFRRHFKSFREHYLNFNPLIGRRSFSALFEIFLVTTKRTNPAQAITKDKPKVFVLFKSPSMQNDKTAFFIKFSW